MYVIHADVSITRRKRYFIITNHEGETVFRSKYFAQILQWLDAEELEEYMLTSEADDPVIMCRRLPHKVEK